MSNQRAAETTMNINSVLITGTSRGIGLGLVKAFLKMATPPRHLFAICRNPSASQELKLLATTHPYLEIIELELTNTSRIKDVYKLVDKKLNGAGLNMIINNAAIATEPSVQTSNQEDMITVYKTNTIAPMLLTQEFIPLLKKAAQESPLEGMSCCKACVINMTSILGSLQEVPNLFSTFPNIAYRTSKVALNMVTRCQAQTYGADGILFVSVHPGWVRTDMGGPKGPLSLQESVTSMMEMFAKLSEEQNGSIVNWKGDTVPW